MPHLITAETILAHQAHPVTGAPHLTVCACGETFRAIPAQSTAFEQWAVHLASALTEATGA